MKDTKTLSKKELNQRKQRRWVIMVTIGTFISTLVFTYISDTVLANAPLFASFIILFAIIGLGIVADIVGVAVTAVNIEPINAMAAKKIVGAKTAVMLVKNAPRVSNVCNDVIGDICGIVSGATSVSIATQLLLNYPFLNAAIISLLMSAGVACMTVGGKALGKDYAMTNATNIISGFAKPIGAIRRLIFNKE